MSLINDALKQARQTPPDNNPGGLTPLQPVPAPSSTVPGWLLPTVVLVLIVIAIAFIGLVVTHRNAGGAAQVSPAPAGPAATTASASAPAAVAPEAATIIQTTQQLASVSTPAIQTQPTNPPTRPVDPPFVLKLQGIDYSPTGATAILNGKTVRPGDEVHKYRVKSISTDTVVVIGPDGKEIKVEMGN